MTALHQAAQQSASRPIRAVIFDMDGLMLDSERLSLECWREAAQTLDVPIHDEAILGMVGMHVSRTAQWLKEQFGPDYPAEAMHAACHEIYLRHTRDNPIPLRPGILEMLDWLECRDIPKAVATSTRRNIALHHLEMADLLRRFPLVICGDEIARPKPAPDIYQAVLARLNIDAADCVVFEDSDYGALAAHDAGCRLIVVPDLLPPSLATRALGAPIVESLHQARELLQRWQT